MKVLVTGGAGYIGSFAVRELVSRGHDVLVLDNLSTGRREAIDGVPLEVCDIRQPEALEGAFARYRPDAVMHFAGLKSPQESMTEVGRYIDVNITGTANLLARADRFGVGTFVLSSSCAVYGTPQVCPVDEQAPLRPTSPYGESKLIAERLVHWYGQTKGMRYANLRYFNAGGAAPDGSLGEYLPSVVRQLVPSAIRAALGLTPHVEVFGDDYPTADGTALRDYIHVVDLAAAHVMVLEKLRTTEVSGVYNLGQGTSYSVLEVLDAVRRVSGREVPVRMSPRREGDPSVSWAQPEAAASVFGWKPRYDLDAIVASAWEWHRDHPESLV